MKWTAHVTTMGDLRKAYKILLGKCECKKEVQTASNIRV
jgi:hypothetical protein